MFKYVFSGSFDAPEAGPCVVPDKEPSDEANTTFDGFTGTEAL